MTFMNQMTTLPVYSYNKHVSLIYVTFHNIFSELQHLETIRRA